MLATIGSDALKNGTGDVVLMMFAGIVGYLFVKLGYSAAALVLGLVLGIMCEENLRRAYQIGAGSWNEAIFTKPIAMVLLLVCAAMLLFPIIKPLLSKKKADK